MKILRFLKEHYLFILFLALITSPMIFSLKSIQDLEVVFNRTVFDAGNLADKLALIQKKQMDANGADDEVLSYGGWDYGLTKRCVKSIEGSGQKFEDTAQCGKEGNWSVYAAATNALGNTCQSKDLEINSNKSPLSLDWHQPENDKGWSVNLITDAKNKTNPCGPNSSMKFAFLDSAAWGGGPLPRPQNLRTEAMLHYNNIATNGSALVFAEWNGLWDNTAKSIEVVLNGNNIRDDYPNDPLLLQYQKTMAQESMVVDGKTLGLSIPKNVESRIQIPWKYVINVLVEKNLITPPGGDWNEAATSAVSFGTEILGKTASNAVLSNLWISDFKITNKK